MEKILFLVLVTIACCTASRYGAKKKHVNTKILILGAGASGIKAAETFYRKGIEDFLILEGKDYIGGRIHHKVFADGLVPLGASSINNLGPKNPTWNLLQKLKMDFHYDNHSDFIVRDGNNGEELTEAEGVHDELRSIFKKVDTKIKAREKSGKGDIPVRSSLGMSGWNSLSSLHQAIEFSNVDMANGASPEILSSRMYSTPGKGKDAVVTDGRGYSHLLKYLAGPFLDRIISNTVVAEIKHTDSGVRVITTDGVTYIADHVLVTFSSGVLINNLVKFTPSLPRWKLDTMHLSPMRHYCKIFLKFPSRFWDDKSYIILAQKNRGDNIHWENYDKASQLRKRNVLLLTLTEDLCLRSEQMNDEEVKIEAMRSLKKVYGEDIPSPTAVLRSQWSSDPMTMGAFSRPVVGFENEDYERLQAPVGRIWFAGEYTTENHGSVHGAFESGEKIAKKVLTCLKTKNCSKYQEKKTPRCDKTAS